MSKSILVIDTPESCKECPCGSSVETMSFDDYCCCEVSNRQILEEVYALEKPDLCPLRDFPEKKGEKQYMTRKDNRGNTETYGEIRDMIAVGWNMCIDEILKGDDEK